MKKLGGPCGLASWLGDKLTRVTFHLEVEASVKPQKKPKEIQMFPTLY